jgi:hypothetical protein
LTPGGSSPDWIRSLMRLIALSVNDIGGLPNRGLPAD